MAMAPQALASPLDHPPLCAHKRSRDVGALEHLEAGHRETFS